MKEKRKIRAYDAFTYRNLLEEIYFEHEKLNVRQEEAMDELVHEEMDGVMYDTHEDASIREPTDMFAELDHVVGPVVVEMVVKEVDGKVVVKKEKHLADEAI
nr:hypothetical protein [Tanacetum cinerariifolium]